MQPNRIRPTRSSRESRAGVFGNDLETVNDIAVIMLSKGRGFAIVDAYLFEELNRLKWWLDSVGYPSSKRGRMHRVILQSIQPDGWPWPRCDHKNRCTFDNTLRNLRPATHGQNIANSRKHRGSTTSRFKGVYWDSVKRRWRAIITVRYRGRHLGNFDSEEAAALAYNEAARIAFGEFANINAA